MLRREVAVLRRQVVRPAPRPSARALLPGQRRLLDQRRRRRFFVQPETLLRWHRDLVRRKWTYARHPGRPSIPAGTGSIVLRLARENPTWGYRRIRGAAATVGVVLAPSSVWAILRRKGIDPSPIRSGPTRAEFLGAQASSMLACDFFSVDTVLLKRLSMLFLIELDTRREHVTGTPRAPRASTRSSVPTASGSSAPRSELPGPTPSSNASCGRFAVNTSIGYRSSATGTSNESWPSRCSSTTGTGRTEGWISWLRSTQIRCSQSTIPSRGSCVAVTRSSVSPPHTVRCPDLGGWDPRHPQGHRQAGWPRRGLPTHAAGCLHLGHCRRRCSPTRRPDRCPARRPSHNHRLRQEARGLRSP